MLKTLTLAGVLMLSTLSMANAAGADMARKPMHGHHNGPCAAVAEACKSAGFTRGGHKDDHKGMMKDCIKPVIDGKSVSGVNIDKSKLDACKADHAARKAKFDAKMKSDPAFAKKMQERKIKWDARKNEMKAIAKPVKE